MKELQEFLRNFLRSEGKSVFMAMIIGKATAFLTSLLIINMLSKTEFGNISIVLSWFTIFAALPGIGLPSALLRFGSLEDDSEAKDQLSSILFWRGFLPQVVISVIFILLALFYWDNFETFLFIFLAFSVRLLGLFFMVHIQAQLRINHDNRGYARSSNLVNVAGFVLVLAATYLFGMSGYLFSMAVSPFFCMVWFGKNLFLKSNSIIKNWKEIRDYGLQSSFTSLLSDAIFSADILLLGYFCGSEDVAGYRAAILIPSNLAFLSLVFIQTDFPRIAKNYNNRNFLNHYIRNYYKIFLPVVLLILLFGIVLRKEIIHMFFGQKYNPIEFLFVLLLLAYCFNLLSRNLCGNLLAAVGKMKLNTIISAATLLLLLFSAVVFVPLYGVQGMAYAVLVTFCTSGAVYIFALLNYVSRQK